MSGLVVTQKSLENQTFKDFEWLVEPGLVSHGNDLNQAYNRALRRAKGELIISLQDNISIAPDTLQRCWDYYKEHPRRFVTFPVSQGDESTWDWRKNGDEQKMKFTDWECDFGMAPLKALKAIGGFDEHLDSLTWGYDNVNVGLRAEMSGYEIWVNPNILAFGDQHERKTFRDKQRPFLHNDRLDQIRNGLKLPVLS